MEAPRLIPLTELTMRIGVGKTKLYDMIKAGEFPKPIKIGKLSRWSTEQVSRWIRDHCRSTND